MKQKPTKGNAGITRLWYYVGICLTAPLLRVMKNITNGTAITGRGQGTANTTTNIKRKSNSKFFLSTQKGLHFVLAVVRRRWHSFVLTMLTVAVTNIGKSLEEFEERIYGVGSRSKDTLLGIKFFVTTVISPKTIPARNYVLIHAFSTITYTLPTKGKGRKG